MILKLNISKQSNPGFKHNLEFSRYPVVIGREDKNDVVLPDQLKVVSRKHAKIIETEGILQLIDLGSANSTHLNGEKIKANEEYAISPGDKISIGDYELAVEFLHEEIPAEDDQKTMLFTNPFSDDAASIIENFKILAAKYALEQSPLKNEMLRMSFEQNVGEIDKNDTNKMLAAMFPAVFGGVETPAPAAGHPLKQEIKPKIDSQPVHKEKHSEIPEEKYLGSHFSNTVDVLLGTFTKLIQGFLQFRQEFFGVTIYHTIPTGSLQEIKQYLFSPENSAEEEKKKLSLLEEETKKLLNHQIGLLEGYRASVTEGSKNFLLSLDPEVIEKEFTEKAGKSGGFSLSKILPMQMKAKVLDEIKENYKRNFSDPYHIEKKYFRPSFLKGYQVRTHNK